LNVIIVLIIKVLVSYMIKADSYLKSQHTLNFFKLALKCPILVSPTNETSLYTKESLSDLIVFEKYETIYLNSAENFAAYIILNIFKNSLATNKSILEYESYFYKTMLGYSLKYFNEDHFNAKLVASYWKLILDIQVKILKIMEEQTVKSVDYCSSIYLNCKHLNSNIKPFSYQIENLITLTHVDESITVVNILPKSKDNSSINLYNLALLKYYGTSFRNSYVFYINLESPSYSFKNFSPASQLNMLIKYYDALVVDFNTPNLFNCSSCYFSESCKDKFKITPVEPDIQFKKRKLIVKNVR